MNLKNITNYINPHKETISISENYIHINNYTKIEEINDKKIVIIIKENKIIINGTNFKVIKMIDDEILFYGQINNLEIIKNL